MPNCTSQHDVNFANEAHCFVLAVSTLAYCRLPNGHMEDSTCLLLLINVTVWQSTVLYAM